MKRPRTSELEPCPQCGDFVSTKRGCLAQHTLKSTKPHDILYFKRRRIESSSAEPDIEPFSSDFFSQTEDLTTDALETVEINKGLGHVELFRGAGK